jgi:hypothetical protein
MLIITGNQSLSCAVVASKTIVSGQPYDHQLAMQKYKNQDTENYNFACCFVWV